jgi:hypothetical protein
VVDTIVLIAAKHDFTSHIVLFAYYEVTSYCCSGISKIINETTSKGYCYFKRQLPTEESKLIGDITPKAVAADAALMTDSTPQPIAEASGSAGGVTASSWNHAGTWEERDLTQFATDRVKELCGGASVSLPGGSASGIEDALKSMEMMTNDDPAASIERMATAMSTLNASVSEVKVKDGDAQIVMARGKKRHCFDFSLTIKFDVVSQDLSGDATKNKKFKGKFCDYIGRDKCMVNRQTVRATVGFSLLRTFLLILLMVVQVRLRFTSSLRDRMK